MALILEIYHNQQHSQKNGKTKFFLHPQQIKQVIHDMLVIMTGLVSDANLIEEATEYHEHNTMKYRCSMFLGKSK